MRFRTLEIRWHDSKPISTCDFQPAPVKKARPPPGQEKNYATQSYRLATGGEDNHVRIWMVHPHLRPPAALADADPAASAAAPRPPRVEYLATLSRHSAAVNVVRFSPNGELIASAGDDGMIIIWAPSAHPQTATYGSDLATEDLQHEKEYWKPRTTFRCTTMQVYDLAWSPSGEYIIAGSTDNTARIFASADGKCVYEVAEHLHYVQGVAWDPLNEYIATQSSDRSMHIYRISTKPGGIFEVHAVGKNTRMPHRQSHSHSQSQSRAHSRTPSAHGGAGGRPRFGRRASMASDAGSSALDLADDIGPGGGAPLTPATSVSSTPAFMFPPPPIEGSSRRSSFSSNAPGSPAAFTTGLPSSSSSSTPAGLGSGSGGGAGARYARSPSPMPPLPAIRSLPAGAGASAGGALWANVKLYGDESYTNFFRRLTFSPDGALLLTPAGQFEDPSVVPSRGGDERKDENTTPVRGRRGHPTDLWGVGAGVGSSSSVYIYSRANFARPPIAQLAGHKKASVAVRFSPVLYELRQGLTLLGADKGGDQGKEKETKEKGPPAAVLEVGVDGSMPVDVLGPPSATVSVTTTAAPTQPTQPQNLATPQRTPSSFTAGIATPSPRPVDAPLGSAATSPNLSPVDLRPPTPVASKPSTPAPSHTQGFSQSSSQTPSQTQEKASGALTALATGSVFALPYRMLFAVVTMDTVAIYDTQQAGPLCLLTKLHYDEFTDMTWSPDGQTLMLSARDGYCTLVMFDDIIPAHHTQQQAMQLQSIAHHNYVPLSYPTPAGHGHVHNQSHNSHTTPGFGSQSQSLGYVGQTTSVQLVPPNKKKRNEPPLTPTASADGSEAGVSYFAAVQTVATATVSGSTSVAEGQTVAAAAATGAQEPPKKKRRVALTRIGDLEP